jgi:DNA-binding transcriptional ArsR family regulator
MRELSEALGLARPSLAAGLNRLRDLGLIEDLREPRPRVRPNYRAIDPNATVPA